MGRIKVNNMLFDMMKGKIGNVIVRNVRGRTIISEAPSKKAKRTKAQRENSKRFARAGVLAMKALEDPKSRRLYEETARKRGGTSNPRSVATQEFMRKLKNGEVV